VRQRLRPIALFLSVALSACASSPGTGGPRGATDLLTAEQLDQLGPGVSAYDALERLRPTWLRDRGTNSLSASSMGDTMPRLHVDSAQLPLDALRSMRTSDIQFIRFMDARDATTRYGTGYVNGLIEVTTRGAQRPG
jgi:hypothetical protein